MNAKSGLSLIVFGLLLLPFATHAEHHGGGSMHGAHSGGTHFGGAHVASVSTRYGYTHYAGRTGYYGHGYHGHGYYGHSYGRGYGRFYGPLAFGVFVATLPLFYDTFWWHGVPYYYDDDTYYRYNSDVSKYEVVAPPGGATPAASNQSVSDELFAYPKNGQSAEQQKTDRVECSQWAAEQTGFDPAAAQTSELIKAEPNKPEDYRRAEIACLTGRGYSVQ